MCRKMFSQTRIKWPDEEIHTDETFSQWMESIDWREAAYKDLGGWDKEWLNTSRNQPDVTGRWEGKGWIPKSRRLGVVEWWSGWLLTVRKGTFCYSPQLLVGLIIQDGGTWYSRRLTK